MNGDLNKVHTSACMIRVSYLLQHPKSMNIIPSWYEIYTSFFPAYHYQIAQNQVEVVRIQWWPYKDQ